GRGDQTGRHRGAAVHPDVGRPLPRPDRRTRRSARFLHPRRLRTPRARRNAAAAGPSVPALRGAGDERDEMSTVIDSHCHLDFPDFAPDLDGIVDRARTANIARMVSISTRVRQFDKLLAITDRFPDVFCSVGTHPHYAHEEPEVTVDDLVAR